METTLTKTYTQEELGSIYNGDTLGIDDELRAQFKLDNPDAVISGSSGEPSENEDGTFTYTITIEYEL